MTIFEKDKEQGRLTELKESQNRKRRRIKHLNNSLTTLGPCESMKPSIFRKFTKLLDQVALFKKKEENIIVEIDRIERKHRSMRKKKMLRAATERNDRRSHDRHKRTQKRRNRFWFILILLLLFWESGKIKPFSTLKPQPR